MSTTDLHLLTGAYVLDALDPDERHDFEAHLRDCVDCATEVDELRDAAARLTVLSAQTPPASLRADVLSGISSTRQTSPHPQFTSDRETTSLQHRLRRVAVPVAAAALGVLALSLGVWGLGERDRAEELRAQAALVTSVLTAPDATTSAAQLGSGSASLVASDELDRAVLVASGIAAPPQDGVYTLWRIDDAGRATAAGTDVPDRDGTLAVPVDGSLDGVTAVAVTVEPDAGSEQPTTAPIAAFRLT